jgi:flagellar L-ring protein FlgH
MRNSNIIFILILLPFVFLGCTVTPEPELTFEKPEIQIPKKNPDPIKNKGSLYSQRGTSLFADKKDLQVGDIIQIIISEDLKSKSTNSRNLSSTRANNLGGGLLASTGTNALSGAENNVNSTLGVGFSTNSDSTDKGAVKTSLAETFSTTVSAIIQETYENGNYYIKGKKEMLVEGQKQQIIVSGVIRPYDITSDNSINSAQVADLKLLYDKDGTESEILDTPWGLKLIRKIWPF